MESLALYTTIYPGVEGFLADWHQSVCRQTDQRFQLWVGLDSLEIDAVEEAVGGSLEATWVPGQAGDTPVQIRQRAWEQIARRHEGVVLVDSDDILRPTRVATARAALRTSDVNACALRLVDERGQDLRVVMQLPRGGEPATILPRHNLFGLSNSAYRCEVLEHCLPIPAEVVHVDWFLITRAWLSGAVLSFDPVVHMDYRQHGANMAQVRGPFEARDILADAASALRHYAIVRAAPGPAAIPSRLAELEEVAADVGAFHEQMASDPERLERYTEALNALPPLPVWWSQVAHPALRGLWTPLTKEPA